MRSYNLFISHSWAYGDAYDKLIGMLNAAPYFSYRDYSVPKDDPIHNAANDQQLREAIKRQMAPCGVVVILAGVYSTYNKWINIEIDLAQRGFTHPKQIIALQPWGAERTSVTVKSAADKIVKWNTSSIVGAIKEYA